MSESQVTDLEDPKVQTPAQVSAKTAKDKKVLKVEGDTTILCGKTKVLTIHRGQGEDGKAPVFLGLNGYGYHIPRGVPCEVPVELVEILDNAKETVYSEGQAEEVPRYAYSAQ